MTRNSAARWAAPVLAVVIAATASAGVTFASSASKGVKACETSKGVLVVATSKGKCPKHDKKVTIGKSGAKGAKGAPGLTGPSNGYVATLSTPTPLASNKTILSVNLPAGAYLLTANVALSNGDALKANPTCDFAIGTTTSLVFRTDVDASVGSPPATLPGFASLGLSSGVSLPAATAVNLVCSSGTDMFAKASMGAQRVGTLTPSGDASFSPSA